MKEYSYFVENKNKKNKIFIVTVVLFWVAVAYFLPKILFISFSAKTGNLIDFLKSAVTEELIPLGLFTFIFLAIAGILGILAAKKIVARVFFFIGSFLGIIFSPLVFLFILANRSCEGFGCLGLSFVVAFYFLAWFIATSVLPVAWASMRNNSIERRRFFLQSVRAGIVVLTVGAITLSPILFETLSYRAERVQIEETKTQFFMLEPTYLPSGVGPRTREIANLNLIRWFYSCNGSEDGLLVYQNRDEDRILMGSYKDYLRGGIVEEVVINSRKGFFLENRTSRSDPDAITSLKLFWHIDDISFLITADFACIQQKEELIKVAESIEYLKK